MPREHRCQASIPLQDVRRCWLAVSATPSLGVCRATNGDETNVRVRVRPCRRLEVSTWSGVASRANRASSSVPVAGPVGAAT